MSYQTPVFTLTLLLWLFLAYRFIRALVNRKLHDRASLYAWGIFFLCYLVVALNVPVMEDEINVHFGGLPVTALVRNMAILVTAHLYFLLTRHIDRPSPRMKRVYLRANPAIVALSFVLFMYLVIWQTPSSNELTHIVKSIREGSMLVWTPLVFIPSGIRMWQLEKYRHMRIRYALSLVFFAAFMSECVSGLVWSFALFFVPNLQAQALVFDHLATYLCLILFFVMLFPFRWLMPLFYPNQLRRYIRLRRLGAVVKEYSAFQPAVHRMTFNLIRATDIDLAIYQEVIAILDMYPSMDDEAETLQRKIQTLVEDQPQYAELVDRLASIRI